MWVVVLDSKGEVADAIRRAQAAAEVECGHKLRVLRTDIGGEFTAAEFTSYCTNEGVQRHYSTPYSPQQNGVVKRRNQTVVGMARALLKQRGMSAVFWGETVVMVVYRQPLSHQGSQRQDVVRGLAWAQAGSLSPMGLRLPRVRQGAWSHWQAQRQEHPGVFIGYAEGSKAYRILDPGTQRVRTTHDVVFDEGQGWAWDKAVDDDSTPTYDNFTIEYVHFKGVRRVGSSLPLSMSTPVPKPPLTSAPRSPATTSAATKSSPPLP
jgi:hypothetical protein